MMMEKLAEKFGKHFSKEAVENAKQAVVEDVQKNHSTYIAAGIIAVAGIVGIAVLTKRLIGVDDVAKTVNITNNYYYLIYKHCTEAAEKATETVAKLAT